MDYVSDHISHDQPHPEQDTDALDLVGRLIGDIGAEIEALKQEREADHIRSARLRLGAVYAKARLEKQGHRR